MSKYPYFSLLSARSVERQASFIGDLPQLYVDDQTIIFERNDLSKDVYFILQGTTKSLNYDAGGKLSYFRMRCAGDCFGYYSAISEEPRTATMIAVGEVKLAKISGKDFFSLVLDNPEIGRNFLKLIVGLLRIETNRISDLTMMSTQQRVTTELLVQPVSAEDSCVHLPDRVEFSSYLGMTRETLSRVLSQLAKKKLIKVEGNRIFLLDRSGMEALIEGRV